MSFKPRFRRRITAWRGATLKIEGVGSGVEQVVWRVVDVMPESRRILLEPVDDDVLVRHNRALDGAVVVMGDAKD
jgi:hypothetical protein